MNKLQSIKKACNLTDLAFAQILKNIRIGVTEKELAKEVRKIFKANKARLAFRPIIAFGKNSYEIHHKPTNKRLDKKGGFILIDIGAKVNGYCADMSRTVFFGKATSRQKKIYKTVLEAQEKSIKFIKLYYNDIYHYSDLTTKDIDRVARDYVVKQNFPNIPHSVGHGIGKRVHEGFKISPKSRTILKNEMVFTIEPGIYIKGVGGVRIEDVFYLNKGKLTQLTKSPKKLTETY